MENLSFEEFEQFQKELSTIGIYEAAVALIEKKHELQVSQLPYSKKDEIDMMSLVIYKKAKIHIKELRFPLQKNKEKGILPNRLAFRITEFLEGERTNVVPLFFDRITILGSKIICVFMDWAKDSGYEESIQSYKSSFGGISDDNRMKERFFHSIREKNIKGFSFAKIAQGVREYGIDFLFNH